MNLAETYRVRFESTGIEKRSRVWRTLCNSYFNELVGSDKDVLDLACGYGEFINNIKARSKIAIDINLDALRYLSNDVRFVHTDATSIDLQDETIDVVFTSNFLEHLHSKSQCDQVFSEVQRVLRPGGRFIVLGPNIKYCSKSYWDFYDHHLSLSHLSLAEGLMSAGYTIESNIPRFLPFTMTGRMPSHDALIRAYLRLPLAWRIFGKQFLVTAKKPTP